MSKVWWRFTFPLVMAALGAALVPYIHMDPTYALGVGIAWGCSVAGFLGYIG